MNKTLIIKSKTKSPSKLVIKLYEMSIDIKNINYLKDGIEFETNYNDYKRLVKYVKGYKFKIKNYTGFSSIINYIKTSKVFIINLILGLILLYVFSNTIVSVKVYHSNKYIRDILYSSLEEYGVKRLSWKKSYKELSSIKEKILDKYKDDIEWLEIENIGMSYIVRVEQRIIPKNKEEYNYCDIVATKDALVKKIKFDKGQAIVDINDYVKEGDTLISGQIKFNDETKNYVCASGSVMGEVWYLSSINMPLYKIEKNYTSKKRYNFMIGNTKIFRSRLKKYKTKKKKIFSIFGINIYKLTEYEITSKKINLTKDEAIKEALKLTKEKIKLKIDKKGSIISQKVLKKSINDSKMYIEIFTTANEIITKQEKKNIEEEKEVE